MCHDPAPATAVLLTPEQAADYINVNVLTLREWRTSRRKGAGPAYVRRGHNWIRYHKADLDSWIAAHRVAEAV